MNYNTISNMKRIVWYWNYLSVLYAEFYARAHFYRWIEDLTSRKIEAINHFHFFWKPCQELYKIEDNGVDSFWLTLYIVS